MSEQTAKEKKEAEAKAKANWKPKTSYVPRSENHDSVSIVLEGSEEQLTKSGIAIVKGSKSINVRRGEDGKGYTPTSKEEEDAIEAFIEDGKDSSKPNIVCSICRYEERPAPANVKALEAQSKAAEQAIADRDEEIKRLKEELKIKGTSGI